MRNEEELDQLIDAALAGYADPGPELARRVLGRIAAEPAPAPRRGWLPWAVALPAAACLLVAILVYPRLRTAGPQPAPANEAAHLQKPEVLTAGIAPRPARRREIAQRAKPAAHNRPSAALEAHAQPLPKLDVFPAPEPLSRQEQALAVFAARTPQPELRALAESEQQEVPLTVASIQVLPLESPDAGPQ